MALPPPSLRPWFARTRALAIAGIVTAGCDRERDPVATPPPARHADAPHEPEGPPPPVVADAPAQAPAPAALAIGDPVPRIEVIDGAGARRCASCEPGPRLLVITGLDAARQDETVRDLDAIARFWADNGLDAVIVLADLAAAGAAPLADAQAEAARGEVAALASEQRLGTTIAAAVEATPRPWMPTLPAVTTAVLVDRSSKVAWVGHGEPHWRALDGAIAGLLAEAAPR